MRFSFRLVPWIATMFVAQLIFQAGTASGAGPIDAKKKFTDFLQTDSARVLNPTESVGLTLSGNRSNATRAAGASTGIKSDWDHHGGGKRGGGGSLYNQNRVNLLAEYRSLVNSALQAKRAQVQTYLQAFRNGQIGRSQYFQLYRTAFLTTNRYIRALQQDLFTTQNYRRAPLEPLTLVR